MGMTSLSCSAVNSGTPVNIGATKIQYGWENYVKEEERIGRFTTGDAMGNVDFIGWGNPKVQIEGVFDINVSSSNWMTLALLKSFTKTTTSVYISDSGFYSSYTKIKIQGFKATRQPSVGGYTTEGTVEGSIINYSIEAIETI